MRRAEPTLLRSPLLRLHATEARNQTLARLIAVGVLLLTVLTGLVTTAEAAAITEEMISVANDGTPGNGSAGAGAISSDGRYVAFQSDADNLVPGDTNGEYDIFVRDRLSHTTERLSVASDGAQGNNGSFFPAISDDGRFVAYYSEASNLVADDTNGKGDLFVRDRLTGTTERVSIGDDESEANWRSSLEGISGDGRYVAFSSFASNLVPGDTNGIPGDSYSGSDVFVRDRAAGTTERVNVSTSGDQANGESTSASISADGRFVAFVSWASNLAPGDDRAESDIFVHDRQTHTTERVPARPGDAGYNEPRISADGRFVVFRFSSATAGVCGILLRDRQTAQTVVVATSVHSWECTVAGPSVSADGRYVSFTQWSYYCYMPAPGGSTASPGDSRSTSTDFHDRAGLICEVCCYAVMLYDRLTDEAAALISGDSPYISADGRYVVFSGGADIGPWQVYLYDRARDRTPPTIRITGGCSSVVCSAPLIISWEGSDDHTPADQLTYFWRLDSGDWHGPTSDTSVDLSTIPPGSYLLQIRAQDLAGNTGWAQCQVRYVPEPPQIVVTSPRQGAIVKGVVTITANISGSGFSRVDFYARGELLCGRWGEPWECTWDTDAVAPGVASICAKTVDWCGRSAEQCITVNVRNQTFEDVPPDHPAWLAIETIAARGITSGCSLDPRLFCPYANVTRAQLAAFICKAAGKAPLGSPTPTFADVPKTHWAYGYIERFCDAESWNGNALQPRRVGASGSPQGAAPGYACSFFPSKKFCPSASVTREQIAWILCTATGKQPTASCSGTFADVLGSNPFCRWIERLADATSWPGSKPVTSGCACPSTSGGASPPGYPPAAKCYCPKSNVTRGQMAVFLVRAFGIPL